MDQVHPLTLNGHVTRADDVTDFTARRTGRDDPDGTVVYEAEVPGSADEFASGVAGVHFDMVPGKSRIVLLFAKASL